MADPQAGPGTGSAVPGESVDGLMEEGLRFLASGRAEPARRLFEKVLERVPSHVEARSRLASAYLMERNFGRAGQEAQKVLETMPEHIRALCIVAECSLATGEPERAQAAVDKVMRSLPRRGVANEEFQDDLACLVRTLAKLEDDRRLDFLGRRYVRGSPLPWDSLTLTRLGVAAWNMGRQRDARWFWRRAGQDPVMENLAPVLLHALDLVEAEIVPPFRMDYSLGVHEVADGHGEPSGWVKAFALHALWQGEDGAAREAALDVLAQGEAGWAEPFLFSLLCRPELDDRLKLRASGWLLERGFLRSNTPVMMHLEGELREVTISSVPRQPHPMDLEGVLWAKAAAERRKGTAQRDPAGGERSAPGKRRRRGRLPTLHPGMAWDDCLATLSKAHLASLARLLRLTGTSRMTKPQLVNALAAWYQENADALMGLMGSEERHLLCWIARQGGVVPFRRLQEYLAHGPEVQPGPGHASVFGDHPVEQRLLALGLLFFGSMEGRGRGSEVVVIPRELRDEVLAVDDESPGD